jgi:peptidoglycan/xylan/chitin deacetylase (PgdA/CDA1 family)
VSGPSGPRAAILLYHRVASVSSDPWRLAVPPDLFERQLGVIAARFRPLPLRELVAGLRAGELPNRAVSLTFDDGYRDNLLAAKPLLERHGVPATVFVISGYIDSERDFWWDVLGRVAPQADEYRAWHRKLQRLPERERVAVLDELAGGADPVPASTVSEGELRQLAAGGLVEIGAHTVTHPSLPSLSAEEQLEEMRVSREHLETAVGQPVEGFSYPYGMFDPETVACARATGFAYACTAERRAVAGDDPFELPRLHVDAERAEAFGARLAAAFEES